MPISIKLPLFLKRRPFREYWRCCFFLFSLTAHLIHPLPVQGEEDDWGSESPPTTSPPPAASPAAPDTRATSSPSSNNISPATTKKIQALKEKAHASYRAQRYEDAGELYRDIANLDTNDAGVHNDIGLCYLKRGMKDSALHAAREALRLADRSLVVSDLARWSFRDLRIRKNAYFTLDKLGGPMPEPQQGKCETWSALSACQSRLHVCAEAGKRSIPGGILHWDILRIAPTRSKALFTFDEVEVPSQAPRPEVRDMEELSVDGEPESRMKWLNRDSSVTIPLGDFIEVIDSACVSECGNLEKVQSECRVIHFDPCAGVVGLACAIKEGGDRIIVGEYYLLPAR